MYYRGRSSRPLYWIVWHSVENMFFFKKKKGGSERERKGMEEKKNEWMRLL